MKSRFLIGVGLLAVVGAALGTTAAAQRYGRFQQIMQRAQERRGHEPADPNATPD